MGPRSLLTLTSKGTTPERRSHCSSLLGAHNRLLLACGLAAVWLFQNSQAAAPRGDVPIATVSSSFHQSILKTFPSARTENMVCSPLGIWRVFRLLEAGADGRTLEQMRSVLDAERADLDIPDLSESSLQGPTDILLFSTDGVFASPLLKDRTFAKYRSTVEDRFRSEVQLVDFGASPAEAANTVNSFVAEETLHSVTEVVSPGDFSADTRLAAVNAMYLRAPWDRPFNVYGDAPFTGLDHEGESVGLTCPFMKKVVGDDGLEYLDGSVKAVRLPYQNAELAMYVFMPDDLEAFESDPRFADVLDELVDYMHLGLQERTEQPERLEGSVEILFPRFFIGAGENNFDASRVLEAMGVKDLFDKANLSRLSGNPNVNVDVFKQVAQITVLERETIASAATAALISNRSLSIAKIRRRLKFDRPFVFQIRRQTNYEQQDIGPGPAKEDLVLFTGHVVDCSTQPDV